MEKVIQPNDIYTFDLTDLQMGTSVSRTRARTKEPVSTFLGTIRAAVLLD